MLTLFLVCMALSLLFKASSRPACAETGDAS
jgi:hypothetical protein